MNVDPIKYWSFLLQGLILFPIRGILSFLTYVYLLIHILIIKFFYKNTAINKNGNELISMRQNFGQVYF